MDVSCLGVVFGHLLENAVEAVPAGGPVTVTAGVVELGDSDARSYLGRAEAGPHVAVSVRDRGPGIKPDVRPKLFAEPFFTTKVRHRGLGLAIAFRTLAAHRGGIRIEPADGGPGVLARVVLPLAKPPGGISP
jgi:signal transduction histidine kinase